MNIMKNPTIWETASRPLFVRTIWLEGSELRRGLQRHFLWDYDTTRSFERLTPLQHIQKENFKRSVSLELNDITDFEALNEGAPEILLLGSAKAKLHEPHKLVGNKKPKSHKYRRRLSSINRQYPSYNSFNVASPKNISRRSSYISQLDSRKNSQQNNETDDVLLAERVLQWLDLKGKDGLLGNLNDLKEMEVKLSRTSKLRQSAIRRYNNNRQNSEKDRPYKTKTSAAQATKQTNNKSAEPVKHITIIFNKEGQPIRLNRPAKNIDLCALSTSPSTTRKLAGTLASARLYQSTQNYSFFNGCKTAYMKSKPKNSRRHLDTVADLNNSTLQKRLNANAMQPSYNNFHDSKKQLHIFMPTLLKKGLTKSVNGTEDGISELSQNFSELCRI